MSGLKSRRSRASTASPWLLPILLPRRRTTAVTDNVDVDLLDHRLLAVLVLAELNLDGKAGQRRLFLMRTANGLLSKFDTD
jgi:hypothetical protein